ncbi:hypothetical protein, partial [Herbaspirillum sp. CF444]|uniref:hypothetical protein n=1 Tax=Herbaspirillum sp. CF444 TaxID=1144319 RepID=UPI001ED97C2F
FFLFIRFPPAVTGYSQADFETGSLRIARGLRWFSLLCPYLFRRSNVSWNPVSCRRLGDALTPLGLSVRWDDGV